MKNNKMVAATVALCFALLGNISTLTAQNNVLKVYPLSGKIGYERLLSPNISGNVSVKFLPFELGFKDDEGNKVSWKNYNISPEVRFYLKKDREKALAGFYLAPYVKAGWSTFEATVTSDSDLEEQAKFRGHTFGIGGTAGWQWVTPNGFSIGTAIGYGVSTFGLGEVNVTYSDGSTEKEKLTGLGFGLPLPQLRFSLGYAF